MKNVFSKSRLIALAGLVLVSCCAYSSQAQGALLAYDGFETVASGAGAGQYNAASVIGQGPGLTGFDAGTNWTGADHPVRPITATDTTSLSYPSLSTNSGSASMTRVTDSSGFNSNATRAANTAGSLAEADVTRWVSFLIEPDLNGVASNVNDPFELNLTFGEDLSLALEDDGDLIVSPVGTTTSLVNRTVNLSEDDTHFLLVSIEHFDSVFGDTSESVSLWLDPNLADGISSLGTPDIVADGRVINASSAISDLQEFASLRLDATLERLAGVAQTVFFDEFRVGMSALDVGALPDPPVIPEPSSLLLLGLGCVGLFVRRRRSNCAGNCR